MQVFYAAIVGVCVSTLSHNRTIFQEWTIIYDKSTQILKAFHSFWDNAISSEDVEKFFVWLFNSAST